MENFEFAHLVFGCCTAHCDAGSVRVHRSPATSCESYLVIHLRIVKSIYRLILPTSSCNDQSPLDPCASTCTSRKKHRIQCISGRTLYSPHGSATANRYCHKFNSSLSAFHNSTYREAVSIESSTTNSTGFALMLH